MSKYLDIDHMLYKLYVLELQYSTYQSTITLAHL